MKKNIMLSTIAAVAVLSIVGCGGGSSSSSHTKTGTGYYVDNAVAGVDYVCGTQKAKTDKDGKFTFEEGKECSFELAGIPLRTTPASELQDGKKVLEDNAKVAKFLQSIDADGDLSNGIQITHEVTTAVSKALKENNLKGDKVPEGQDLVKVVASVGNDVPDVSGDVRTDAEVQTHLTGTKTEITKALLAGKTFYVVGDNGDDKTKVDFFKIVVDKDVTQFKSYFLDGTFDAEANIKIVANKLIFTDDTDGSYSLISQENGYVFADDRNADNSKDGTIGHRFYPSQSDAQTYFDSYKGGSTTDTSSYIVITEEMLNGKTFYSTNQEEGGIEYKKTSFSNGVITQSRLSNEGGEVKSDSNSYSIDNGKILTDNNGFPMHLVLIKENSNNWEMRAQSTTNASDGKDIIFYLTKPSNYPAEL